MIDSYMRFWALAIWERLLSFGQLVAVKFLLKRIHDTLCVLVRQLSRNSWSITMLTHSVMACTAQEILSLTIHLYRRAARISCETVTYLCRNLWKRACSFALKIIYYPVSASILRRLRPKLSAFLLWVLEHSYSFGEWIDSLLRILEEVELHSHTNRVVQQEPGVIRNRDPVRSINETTADSSEPISESERYSRTTGALMDMTADHINDLATLNLIPPLGSVSEPGSLDPSPTIHFSSIFLLAPPATPATSSPTQFDFTTSFTDVSDIFSFAATPRTPPTPEIRGSILDTCPTNAALQSDPDDPLLSFDREDSFMHELSLENQTIGEGSYGSIYRGMNKGGRTFAVKILGREGSPEQDIALQDEINAMDRAAGSDWVVKLEYWQASVERVLIAMSYFSGGSLYDFANSQRMIETELAIFWTAEILLGLHAVHTLGIIHRDIKPENIMFDVSGHIKIIDFGLAKLFDHESVSKAKYPLFHRLRIAGGDLFPQIWALETNPHISNEPFGTQGFAPPEVWQRKNYSFGVDYFAMGCVLHELLTGKLPFVFDCATGNYDTMDIRVDPGRVLSEIQRDFFNKALSPNAMSRPSVSHMKKHPIFGNIDWHKLSRREIEPPISF